MWAIAILLKLLSLENKPNKSKSETSSEVFFCNTHPERKCYPERKRPLSANVTLNLFQGLFNEIK